MEMIILMQYTKKFDAVIIGAGVIGCAVARWLSRSRISIAVMEKEAEPAMGSSGANTGLVHAGFDPEPDTLKAKFNVEGAKMFPALCEELGVHYEPSGAMVVAFNDEERATLEVLLERGKTNGVEGMRVIEGAELFALEPNLNRNAVAALYAPSAGMVCPYGLTFALADDAAANGVQFFRNCAVRDIAAVEDGYCISTDEGEIFACVVVNAAGLYSDVINNMVSAEKLTIKPNRGEYWIVDKALAGKFRASIFRTPTAAGKGILITPTVDGTLLAGPTAENVEDKADVDTTSAGLDTAFNGAQMLWPELRRADLITTFAGNRAKVAGGDFIIGQPADAPGFFNAVGIDSPGLSSAPAIGKYLAGEIAEYLDAEPKSSDMITAFVKPARAFDRMNDEEREKAIAADREYGRIVCRCETVTEAEIRDAIRRPVGARTVDGIKHRTRSGMGRCQGGFCMPVVVDILCDELGIMPTEVTKNGVGSELLTGRIGEESK